MKKLLLSLLLVISFLVGCSNGGIQVSQDYAMNFLEDYCNRNTICLESGHIVGGRIDNGQYYGIPKQKVKDFNVTPDGIQVNFEDGTGYWFE